MIEWNFSNFFFANSLFVPNFSLSLSLSPYVSSIWILLSRNFCRLHGLQAPYRRWASSPSDCQLERQIRPKCIGSCVHVLFPFNRVSTFKITSVKTVECSALDVPGFWSHDGRPWIHLTTMSSVHVPMVGLRTRMTMFRTFLPSHIRIFCSHARSFSYRHLFTE